MECCSTAGPPCVISILRSTIPISRAMATTEGSRARQLAHVSQRNSNSVHFPATRCCSSATSSPREIVLSSRLGALAVSKRNEEDRLKTNAVSTSSDRVRTARPSPTAASPRVGCPAPRSETARAAAPRP